MEVEGLAVVVAFGEEVVLPPTLSCVKRALIPFYEETLTMWFMSLFRRGKPKWQGGAPWRSFMPSGRRHKL